VNPATVPIPSPGAVARERLSSRITSTDCSSPTAAESTFFFGAQTHAGAAAARERRNPGGGGQGSSPLDLTTHRSGRSAARSSRTLCDDTHQVPELPGNLYTHRRCSGPSTNAGAARHRVEASISPAKLSWNADYVSPWRATDKAADIDGEVTLENGSGTSSGTTKLQLGPALNRVRTCCAKERFFLDAFADRRARTAAAERSWRRRSFSDYHLIARAKDTINNNGQAIRQAPLPPRNEEA